MSLHPRWRKLARGSPGAVSFLKQQNTRSIEHTVLPPNGSGEFSLSMKRSMFAVESVRNRRERYVDSQRAKTANGMRNVTNNPGGSVILPRPRLLQGLDDGVSLKPELESFDQI